MSILIPETEDIEKLQKRFSEALGDDYQVEMYTEVSSSFFLPNKKSKIPSLERLALSNATNTIGSFIY